MAILNQNNSIDVEKNESTWSKKDDNIDYPNIGQFVNFDKFKQIQDNVELLWKNFVR